MANLKFIATDDAFTLDSDDISTVYEFITAGQTLVQNLEEAREHPILSTWEVIEIILRNLTTVEEYFRVSQGIYAHAVALSAVWNKQVPIECDNTNEAANTARADFQKILTYLKAVAAGEIEDEEQNSMYRNVVQHRKQLSASVIGAASQLQLAFNDLDVWCRVNEANLQQSAADLSKLLGPDAFGVFIPAPIRDALQRGLSKSTQASVTQIEKSIGFWQAVKDDTTNLLGDEVDLITQPDSLEIINEIDLEQITDTWNDINQRVSKFKFLTVPSTPGVPA